MKGSSIFAMIGFVVVLAGIAAAVYYFFNKKGGLCRCCDDDDEDGDVIIVDSADELGDFSEEPGIEDDTASEEPEQ